MTSPAPSNARSVDLSLGAAPIGRASAKEGDRTAKSSNFFIRNSHLSKAHARVWAKDGEVYLQDVGSTFGTVWNHNLLAPDKEVMLSAGDTVGFVINRPSFVIRNLYLKNMPLQMMPLDKLLNPRVQLQFTVHSTRNSRLVLVPANDPTSDATGDMSGNYEDVTYVEDTPPSVVVELDEDSFKTEVSGHDSDEDAPEEEKIVKEVTSSISQILCDIVTEKQEDTVDYDEEESEFNSFSMNGLTHYYNDGVEDWEEEDVKVTLVEALDGAESFDEEDVQVPSGEDLDLDISSDEEDEEEVLVALCPSEDEPHIILKCCQMPKNWAKIHDCEIPPAMLLDDEHYKSADDDTYNYSSAEWETEDEHLSEHESDFEGINIPPRPNYKYEEKPGDESSDEEYVYEDRYADEETISEADSADLAEESADEDEVVVVEAAPASKKRTYDEADLEEEPIDTPPVPTKKAYKVLKEVGRGALYVLATVFAMGVYGSTLED